MQKIPSFTQKRSSVQIPIKYVHRCNVFNNNNYPKLRVIKSQAYHEIVNCSAAKEIE